MTAHGSNPGPLRRVARGILGGAAILIVGVGALPAADASAAGVSTGLKNVSAAHSATGGVSPTQLPAESRAVAARFAVDGDGKLVRLHPQ
ncbi:hypothetical protein HJ588_02580 [Flexivirga sp. ID2601S]|uniref:Uncharacterized protein n=1 Tax=Flexivirga aerilata TaxID=1656889 RepID=A0A849ACF4_9MICO|nr:hypothetical protein [Flexivirga aerilata]NNG38159.1 hypothetical protein [Flexivirga aerilata]